MDREPETEKDAPLLPKPNQHVKKKSHITHKPTFGKTEIYCFPLFLAAPHLCPRNNTPRPDLVVGVTSKQGLAVRAPCERHALRSPAVLALVEQLGLELVDLALLLEIKDDDAGGSGSAEPVSVGGEDKSVDLITGVEGVEVLGLVKVPEHGGAVLAAGSAEGSVRGDGDGVDVASVTGVVSLDTTGGELPNLATVSVYSNTQSHIKKKISE